MANYHYPHLLYNYLDNCFKNFLKPKTIEQLLEGVNEQLREVDPDAGI
jgi:hypothetical protein